MMRKLIVRLSTLAGALSLLIAIALPGVANATHFTGTCHEDTIYLFGGGTDHREYSCACPHTPQIRFMGGSIIITQCETGG